MEPILSTPAPNAGLPLALDHLVVAARTLDEGEAWLRARLGRSLVAGGAHPGFGTHNQLLGLGAGAGCYLELIAPDPQQPAASRVLFGLDEPAVAASLAQAPLVLHAVFRVLAPARLATVLPLLAYDPGTVTRMTRGALAWDITIPPGCRLRGNGLLPTLIDWGTTAHPSTRLPDCGVRLAALRLAGPEPVIAEFPLQAAPAVQSVSREAPAADSIKLELACEPCSTISAEFLVDGQRIIIRSCLPLRNLA